MDQLLEIQNQLESKVVSVTTLEDEIVALEIEIKDFEIQLDEIAKK